MARFIKFLFVALIGFGIGAALAYYQRAQLQQPVEIVGTTDVTLSDAPEQPAAVDIDAANPLDHAGHDHAAHTSPESASGVAGSTVGGAFTLRDFNDNQVTEKSWPGKLKLVFFGFTSCPDICPAALDKITNALEILATDQIQPIFITVDPERDSNDVMKAYLSGYASSIVGLSGTDEQLKAAREGYKVYAAKGEKDAHGDHYNVDHSGYIYLIGENETLLEIFGSSDTAESLANKIRPHVTTAVATETAPETAPDTTPAVVADDAVTAETPAPVVDETPAAPAAEVTDAPVADTPAATDVPMQPLAEQE